MEILQNKGFWLIVLVVTFGLFLLLREFYCWYWKQNKMVSLLEEINKNLKEIKQGNKSI